MRSTKGVGPQTCVQNRKQFTRVLFADSKGENHVKEEFCKAEIISFSCGK